MSKTTGKPNGRIVVMAFMLFIFVLFIVCSHGFDLLVKYINGEDSLPIDYGYSVGAYDINISINEDGSYDITEEITATFTELSHGLVRYLPKTQTVKYYNIKNKLVSRNRRNAIYNFRVFDGYPTVANTSYSNGYKVFYFGDEDHEFTGTQVYKFSYTLDPGDDRDSSMDMFYYNVVGTGWNTTIDHITFNIEFLEDVSLDDVKFYVGKYGDNTEDSGRISLSVSGNTISGTCSHLAPYEAITSFKSYKNGYFDYSSHRHVVFDCMLIVFFAAIVGAIIIVYFKKRETQPIVDVVEFKAPDGLTPTEAGCLIDGKVSGKDLSALIVYWASRGNVIIADKGGVITVVKDKDLPDDAKEHEKELFDALFKQGASFEASKMPDIGTAGYDSKKSVEKEMRKNFDTDSTKAFSLVSIVSLLFMLVVTIKGLYQEVASGWILFGSVVCFVFGTILILMMPTLWKNKSKMLSKKFWVLFGIYVSLIAISFITISILLGGWYDLFLARFYMLVVPALLLFVGSKIRIYSDEGKRIVGQVRGLRNYILVAEKDKLEMLVKDNPSLFFEILPYAYVLGVSDVYMKKFEDIKIE
ncbi:MAG: DUF2207 domain-containing protein, partial [Clostridia bacterium]|nr:DUF2207 domain-containing protein [Clostridia bacterium]